MTSPHPIVIFTDGACSGNPSPGGWGSIITWPNGKVLELGGALRQTTNNQMELLAGIEALRYIQSDQTPVNIYTDSTYVIRGITQWVWGWRKRDWKTAEGKEVANQDLWKRLISLVSARTVKPEWKYVRGHQGTPGNERVDEIAVAFTQGRRIELFSGTLRDYPIAIHDVPEDTSLPEIKPREAKIAALSYLSVVNGVPMRHATWKDCEARVKGRAGAKFKKALDGQQENEILEEWGYSDQDLPKR